MLELRAFITNLGKYNEGELVGEWVDFPIDEDEEQELMERIGIDGEEYEEYFVTDYEGSVDWHEYFGEYPSIEWLNETAEKLDDWDEDLFCAVCEYEGIDDAIDEDPLGWYLLPDVNTDEDLGYYYATELGYIDFSDNEILARYFDYEAYGRDIRLGAYYGGFTNYGWLEQI